MFANNSIGTDGGCDVSLQPNVKSGVDSRVAQYPGGDDSGEEGAEVDDVASIVHRALDTCRTNHQFITSQAEHLHRLRSQCATSALITRQEIRALEAKLVKLFGQQLACKRLLPLCAILPVELHNFPCLTQWLSVVGLPPDVIKAVHGTVVCLEELLALSEAAVTDLFTKLGAAVGHTNKLLRALHNLRRYTELQVRSGGVITEADCPLYWDSWEQNKGSCPSSPRAFYKNASHREARSSVSSSDGDTSDLGAGGNHTSSTTSSGFVSSHQHRSSDESSTPSSPPVAAPHHPHCHHTLPPNLSGYHHHSSPGSHFHHHSGPGVINNVPSNIHMPGSPLHPPQTALTLQLPPVVSNTELRYTPPPTPPVIKSTKVPEKKVSTPPPNIRYLLNPASGGAATSNNAIGRSASHESQLTTSRRVTPSADATDHHHGNSNSPHTPLSNSHHSGGAVAAGVSMTPPHNALEMAAHNSVSHSSHDSRHHSHGRHHSESSTGESSQQPCTPHHLHHYVSTPPLPQFASPSSLSSPTRQVHYSSYHPHAPAEEDCYNKNASVPRSPRTPPLQGSMVHNVQHRFAKTFKPATCGYCHQKFALLGGLRCKECNFKCHRECESKLPPSCGLPSEYLKIFTDSLQHNNRVVSPSHQADNLCTPPLLPSMLHASNAFHGPDSSSNTSSCNSSTPSSPALILPPPSPATLSSSSSSNNSGKHLLQQSATQQQHHHHHHLLHHAQHQQHGPGPPLSASSTGHNEAFHYPDISKRSQEAWTNFMMRGPPSTGGGSTIHSLTSTTSSTLSAASTIRSDLVDTDRTTVSTNSGSGSTDDSERTVAERVDSQDSTISDGLIDSVGGVGGVYGGGYGDGGSSGGAGGVLGGGCSRQNSVSQGLREVDIPYHELDKGKIIGRGRFGTVYSGNWHGQVAIKELHMEYGNDQNTLEAFKSEVAMFRKARHENLILFMGACMKLPRLAIVTSLCKGNTLYKHIHLLREKFTMSNTISIAQQVAQGMGYLHARGIVHKDLKTKNIFIENGKVVITDYGLVNLTRLCQNNRPGAWLSIPAGWLCYLSPELMRSLQVSTHQPHPLPYTTTTDVYAYGTVWFELLCGEWPHKGLPPEAIIWQVGRGIKPSLAHLQASRDVKDILMECWAYLPDERPDFASLQKQLKKLPKKKLARSPSHPIHLSRSAECVF